MLRVGPPPPPPPPPRVGLKQENYGTATCHPHTLSHEYYGRFVIQDQETTAATRVPGNQNGECRIGGGN